MNFNPSVQVAILNGDSADGRVTNSSKMAGRVKTKLPDGSGKIPFLLLQSISPI